jgi:hypothetical protein
VSARNFNTSIGIPFGTAISPVLRITLKPVIALERTKSIRDSGRSGDTVEISKINAICSCNQVRRYKVKDGRKEGELEEPLENVEGNVSIDPS